MGSISSNLEFRKPPELENIASITSLADFSGLLKKSAEIVRKMHPAKPSKLRTSRVFVGPVEIVMNFLHIFVPCVYLFVKSDYEKKCYFLNYFCLTQDKFTELCSKKIPTWINMCNICLLINIIAVNFSAMEVRG